MPKFIWIDMIESVLKKRMVRSINVQLSYVIGLLGIHLIYVSLNVAKIVYRNNKIPITQNIR